MEPADWLMVRVPFTVDVFVKTVAKVPQWDYYLINESYCVVDPERILGK